MFRGDWFDYCPLTGAVEYYEETADGKCHIHTYQDIEPILDYAQELANAGSADECWRKYGATTYAIIPPVLQGELYKKGLNFLDPNHTSDVVREINANYPRFKTTHKHHTVKRK